MYSNKNTPIIKQKSFFIVQLFDLFVFLLSIISATYYYFYNSLSYTKVYILLPIAFGTCYLFILAPIIREKKSQTTIIVSICFGLRFILLPFVVTITGYSGFEQYKTNDTVLLTDAVMLMCWELLFISFVLFILTRKNYECDLNNRIESLGKDIIPLFVLFLLGLCVFIISPDVKRYVSFLSLSSNSEKVRGLTAGQQSSFVTLLIKFAQEALLCFFILVLDVYSVKFNKKPKKIYVMIPTIVGFFTVGLIIGESRATIVYTLYAVLSCLVIKFEKHKRRIACIMIFGAVFILIGMTMYRLFAVYNYASYGAALANKGNIRENYFSSFVESYLLGPQSVAAGISFKNKYKSTFTVGRLLFDLFRPFMGLNIVLKKLSVDTSITLYNSWLFGVAGQSNGLFLQITNQGYCYFGFFFAPLFTSLFILLSVKIEKWMKNTKSLFVYFFLAYTFIRTSTCVLGGTMNDFITTGSMTLFMTLLFFVFQKAFGSIYRRA